MSFIGTLERGLRHYLYALLGSVLRNVTQHLPIDVQSVRKILVFRYDRMGDAIVTLPALRVLKENTQAEIHVLCSAGNVSVFDDCSFISKRIVLGTGFGGHLRTIWDLRRQGYDLILGFVFDRTTYAGMLANAISRRAIKVGRMYAQRESQYSVLFNIRLDLISEQGTMAAGLHAMCCRLLRLSLKSNPLSQQSSLILHPSRIEKAKQLAASISKRSLVMVNVSAGTVERNFSISQCTTVISHLLATLPLCDIIVLGIQRDGALVEEVVLDAGPCVHAVSNLNHILDVAALLQCVKLLVTPDTSVLHLADILEVPVVGCYLKEHPEWYPTSTPYRLVFCPTPNDFSSLSSTDINKAIDSLLRETGLFE